MFKCKFRIKKVFNEIAGRKKYRYFTGFTLAEILITLGIIGVVAAITIPTLIQNSNSRKFITQYKKSMSTLNQAAIAAQAQYDMDYATLSAVSKDSACNSDTLAGGQYSLCGLFNNTLTGHTYIGKYGVVKGANNTSLYSPNVTSFIIDNFLFFALADGSFVGFNPNAKGCALAAGSVLTSEMLTSGVLSNCLGFIDVNGANPPNIEVSCDGGNTSLSVNTSCHVTNAGMGDIFPVVFHDGMVIPATNASLAAFLGSNGKEVQETDPFDGHYFTDQNGNKLGYKLLTDEDGNVPQYTGWQIFDEGVNPCPAGSSVPDAATLENLLQQNLGEVTYKPIYAPDNPWFWKYEYSNQDVGALGLPTTGIFWSTSTAGELTMHGYSVYANTGREHVDSRNNNMGVICVQSQ